MQRIRMSVDTPCRGLRGSGSETPLGNIAFPATPELREKSDMKVRADRVDVHVLREWFSYEATTGEIRWIKGKNKVVPGSQAGYVNSTGHRVIKIGQKRYFAHRVAWAMHYGKWPPDELDVDHINGERDDNSAANLRIATRSQNLANSKRPSTNTSGIKGVVWSKSEGCWKAQIRVQGKSICLGYYTFKESAADAYRSAASKFFGDFANYG